MPTYFYGACADVLNEKEFTTHLKPALEGRLYTLKNALIAQNSPEIIKKSRALTPNSSQELATIKEEGASYIRESLRLHLHAIKAKECVVPFRELLVSTATQAIPFVQRITQSYLRENGKECPDNPLTFRNPTGYNHHGLVAASVMEACLNVFGYQTRLMARCDLDPRITLATMHRIVEVTAPEGMKYIVDPCCIQFHKDISPDETSLPTNPVLVLSQTEVEGYIETNLMTRWKEGVRRLEDPISRQKIIDEDKLALFVDRLEILAEAKPACSHETWVRDALRRVWTLATYCPNPMDPAFQEIFYGSGTTHSTYDLIKSMGLSSLTHHLSYEEVERRLEELRKDPQARGSNFRTTLSLIARLDLGKKRDLFAPLLDVDSRPTIDITLKAYLHAIRKVVNPEGKDKRVIYGCSGADGMSVLLTTDANDLTFVDLTTIRSDDFATALKQFTSNDPFIRLRILDQIREYFHRRIQQGGGVSKYENGIHSTEDLALKLFFDLQNIGVDLSQVTLTPNRKKTSVRIDFPWQYHGEPRLRNRSLTFVTADITNPETYPALLKTKLKEGIDIFYMKAAFFVPRYYPKFLPDIAKNIREGGWLMTADKTFLMETVNPEQCLEQNGLSFALQNSAEIQTITDSMVTPFHPLENIPMLEMSHQVMRPHRTTGTNLTYWALVNLRKKVK